MPFLATSFSIRLFNKVCHTCTATTTTRMDDAARRKQDIELKKKRLAEMRKTRVEGAAAAVSAPAPVPEAAPVVAPPVNEAAETEDLVSSLLASVSLAPTKQEPVVTAVIPSKSREEMLREKIASFTTVKSFNTISILPTTMVKYDKTCQTEEEDQFFLANPSDVLNETALESDEEEDEEETEAVDASHQRTPSKGIKSPSPRKGLFSPKVQQSQIYGKLATDLEVEAKFVTQAQVKLSEEERAKITANKVFQSFLQTTSLYVERALAVTQEHDVIRDFSVDEQGTSGDLDAHAAFLMPTMPLPGHAAGVSSVYEEEGLAGRPVMDLRWSPLVPELFLAAYGARTAPVIGNGSLHKTASFRSNGTAPTAATTSSAGATTEEEAPGVVCVWSRDLHRRPEFRFTASSPVLAAVFHSHEQHLVLGGCYSGQILLWDMKLNKALPVQRSSMSGKGHKHPVYAMAMTSSAVAAELISVSTDGLLCHWDVTRLTEPLSVVQLHVPAVSTNPLGGLLGGFLSPVRETSSFSSGAGVQTNPLNISAMAFGQSALLSASSSASGDHHGGVGSTDIIFGSGSGQLVRTPLPYKDNNPGSAKVDAHYGLITSIEPHPSRSNKYKHLVLSSSLDWTVKLWDLKNFSQPLIEFFTPSYDYVCDVQWSPVHPAVFVTVTSGGRISLWNLAKSSTEPVDAINVVNDTEDTANSTTASATGTSAGAAGGAHPAHAALRALNKVVWARDGQSVLCGDSQGTLHLLKLHAPAVTPTPADEGRFEMAIVSHQVDSTHHSTGESKYAGAHGSEVTPTKGSAAGRMFGEVTSRSVEAGMDLLLE